MSHADEPIATDEADSDEPTLFDETASDQAPAEELAGFAETPTPQTRGEHEGSIQIRLPPRASRFDATNRPPAMIMMTHQSLSKNQPKTKP